MSFSEPFGPDGPLLFHQCWQGVVPRAGAGLQTLGRGPGHSYPASRYTVGFRLSEWDGSLSSDKSSTEPISDAVSPTVVPR
jgi:hypothetical protein